MFGFTFLQIAWYLVIYSFLGWCLEVVYCTVTSGKVVNRGFLNGPVCPVYGFGMLALLAFLRCLGVEDVSQANPLVLFLAGMILASAVEFIAGWGLMKLFHARWWDYTMRPFNLGGYICLQFSLAWGCACVFALRIFHVTIEKIVNSGLLTSTPGFVILAFLYVVFISDFILTLFTVIGISKRLKELDELSKKMRIVSDGLSEKLGTGALKTDQKFDEGRLQMALAKAEARDAAEELKKDLKKKSAEAEAAWDERVIGMKEKLDDLKENITENLGDMKDQTTETYAALQKRTEELTSQLIRRSVLGAGRIINAFPGLKSHRYDSVFEEVKRKKNEK